MAQQTIGIGADPNDDTGDTLRIGGDKINDNFTELYARVEHPYMGIYFSTPALTTITTATEYVKAAGTTSTSNISSTMSTDSVDNRIKYTGTVMTHFHIVAQASVTLSSGTNQDIGIQVWKYDSSGAAGTLLAHSEARTTIAGTDVVQITTHADVMLDENDYIEMHIANHTNTNDVTVDFGYMFAVGMR